MSDLPPHLREMTSAQFRLLLEFANDVQRWSLHGTRRIPRYGTFGQAAKHFGVPVERIADAVEAHYWMFTPDKDLPIEDREIDHEGE